LQRGQPVAGLDPELARNIARACHDHWSSTAAIADQVQVPVTAASAMLEQLADAGYLERRVGRGDGDVEWHTTITGGAQRGRNRMSWMNGKARTRCPGPVVHAVIRPVR
jgi:predicted ArsR family transcriptional regulator